MPSDNWDLDATHESMLVDLVIGDVERKALIETSKIGWSVVLDREAGRFINVFRTGYATSSPAGPTRAVPSSIRRRFRRWTTSIRIGYSRSAPTFTARGT